MTNVRYFQSHIGVLRYIAELGKVNVCLEVSMMSSHLQRQGQLEQLYQIFGYLKRIVMRNFVQPKRPFD